MVPAFQTHPVRGRAGVGKLLLLVAGLLSGVSCQQPWGAERLRPAGQEAASSLPPDTVVLPAAKAEALTAPVALGEDVSAVGGAALVVAEGGASPERKGKASWPFNVATAGQYRVWAHVWWQDSCGNSILVKVDDAPPYAAGQDPIYHLWHWVPAGSSSLAVGPHRLAVLEREDGIAVDQLLLTRDPAFVPTGPVLAGTRQLGIRRFADDFARSPGHGMEAWDLAAGKWDIAFSLDPNRLPNQYALVGETNLAGQAAVALIKGPVWKGCSLASSVFPLRPGRFGVVLDRTADGRRSLTITVAVSSSNAWLQAQGSGIDKRCALGAAVRLNQWHRLAVARWAWTLRVSVDDQTVLESLNLEPASGSAGLYVGAGAAVFDDVLAQEIPWQAEDRATFRIPWMVPAEAQWYRAGKPGGAWALDGRKGSISAGLPGLNVEEVQVEETGPSTCAVSGQSLEELPSLAGIRRLRRDANRATQPGLVRFGADQGPVQIRKIAIRYGDTFHDVFRLGLYHFTETQIEDPSDYLDFTEEEYRQIQQSPEADKLTRKPKFRRLVGPTADCVWVTRQPGWQIKAGVLEGSGPDAVLRYWDDVPYALQIQMRLKTLAPDMQAGVEVGHAPRTRRRGPVAADAEPAATNRPTLWLNAPADGTWHTARMELGAGFLRGGIEGQAPQEISLASGAGSSLMLRVLRGSVQFDDIELDALRQAPHEFFYAFDRQETDWWRDGGVWADHGGIACLSGSHWIALSAPQGAGMLWNKRHFSSNLLVAFKVEENTEWFGWHAQPDHIHYPFDNIRVALSTNESQEGGYVLEVNAKERTATVLYRQGVEVASVPQDRTFPIRYVGGHSPYVPRRNLIMLRKQQGEITATINGQEVLRFDDPNPLPVSRVGLGGYKTHVNFSEVLVREGAGTK